MMTDHAEPGSLLEASVPGAASGPLLQDGVLVKAGDDQFAAELGQGGEDVEHQPAAPVTVRAQRLQHPWPPSFTEIGDTPGVKRLERG